MNERVMNEQSLANGLADRFPCRWSLFRRLSLSPLILLLSTSLEATGPSEDLPAGVPRLTSISVTAPTTTLASPTGTVQLTVRGTFDNGSTLDVTAPQLGTRYQSNSPSVISVDANGLVTALARGQAEVF